ncbi:MAG: MotA/TolQ/ExbB proton channel family protein [Bradyrhizobium sp.]|nr:MotA/TolQ/ExbB proton channel family protein [Bradyrhizobium sp.]
MLSLAFLKDVDHRVIRWGSLGLALVTIYLLYLTLPDKLAIVLLDLNREHRELGRFPYSVQTAMWVSFFFALGELLIRRISADIETDQLSKGYLPEEFTTVLQASDLPPIYRELRSSPDLNKCFLPRLIDRCILQFQASQSIDQSASLLNTSVEMFLHEVDLNYNMVRYICWLIPSLGFIGTVVGIGEALEYAGKNAQAEDLLGHTTGQLAVSFHGTFLALLMASILVFLQNRIQSKEEHALNLGAQYCLDNLINRLYVVK